MTTEPVAMWRDGVHVAATPLWCDAYRARDVCFVSSADAVKPTRHGQVIATTATLALLSRSQPQQRPDDELAVPVARPFTLGTIRVELFDTAHAIGAAGLWVRIGQHDVVYAGSICPRGTGLGGACDARSADTLIVAAHYGDSQYRFPDSAVAAAEVISFCQEVSAQATAVLLVSSAVKGLDVAAHVASAGLEVWTARPIHHAARKLARAGVSLPALRRASAASAKAGRVLVWPVSSREQLPTLPEGSRVALVSGEAVHDGDHDRGFAWSNRADYNDLISYIEGSGASNVLVTGRFNDALARSLDRPGRRVRPLGPPKQLSLL